MKKRFTKPSNKIIEFGRYSHAKNSFQEEVSCEKKRGGRPMEFAKELLYLPESKRRMKQLHSAKETKIHI